MQSQIHIKKPKPTDSCAAVFENNSAKMRAMNAFIQGFGCALAGLKILSKPKVRRFVIVPFVINILLFALGFWYLYSLFDNALALLPNWLQSLLNQQSGGYTGWFAPVINMLQNAVGGLVAALKYLLWGLFFSAYMLAIFYFFSIIANLISSPFNGYLAQAVECNLAGVKKIPEHIELPIGREIINTLKSETLKVLYSVKFLVPLLLISLLFMLTGVLSPLIAPLWFLYGAWMLSVVYIEYPLGNYGIVFQQQKQLQKQHKLLCLGFGVAIMCMTLIPVLNFIAVPTAVAGATKLFQSKLREQILLLK